MPARVSEPDKFRSREKIRQGRIAWKIAATERCRPPNSFSAASDRRQRWREIGEALLEGRAICADVDAFVAWRKAVHLDMPGLTSHAAMWLAQNWETVVDLETKVSHPEQLLRLHKSGGLSQIRRTAPSAAAPFTVQQRSAIRDMLNGIRNRLDRRVLARYEVRDGHHFARIEHCPPGDDFGPAPRWPLVSIVSRGDSTPLYRVLSIASATAEFPTFPEALRATKVALLRMKCRRVRP